MPGTVPCGTRSRPRCLSVYEKGANQAKPWLGTKKRPRFNVGTRASGALPIVEGLPSRCHAAYRKRCSFESGACARRLQELLQVLGRRSTRSAWCTLGSRERVGADGQRLLRGCRASRRRAHISRQGIVRSRKGVQWGCWPERDTPADASPMHRRYDSGLGYANVQRKRQDRKETGWDLSKVEEDRQGSDRSSSRPRPWYRKSLSQIKVVEQKPVRNFESSTTKESFDPRGFPRAQRGLPVTDQNPSSPRNCVYFAFAQPALGHRNRPGQSGAFVHGTNECRGRFGRADFAARPKIHAQGLAAPRPPIDEW